MPEETALLVEAGRARALPKTPTRARPVSFMMYIVVEE